jgi:hypothetical protein
LPVAAPAAGLREEALKKADLDFVQIWNSFHPAWISYRPAWKSSTAPDLDFSWTGRPPGASPSDNRLP